MNPFGSLGVPKRKIFISYHHGLDRWYYEQLQRAFCYGYDFFTDNSVERVIDSYSPEYVIRRIRENYIVGTSCTIVLCGQRTYGRKFVDWEIKATLDKCHGLVGIVLPSAATDASGSYLAPDRLVTNVDTKYATWVTWNTIQEVPDRLARLVDAAARQPTRLIDNSQPLMNRNTA